MDKKLILEFKSFSGLSYKESKEYLDKSNWDIKLAQETFNLKKQEDAIALAVQDGFAAFFKYAPLSNNEYLLNGKYEYFHLKKEITLHDYDDIKGNIKWYKHHVEENLKNTLWSQEVQLILLFHASGKFDLSRHGFAERISEDKYKSLNESDFIKLSHAINTLTGIIIEAINLGKCDEKLKTHLNIVQAGPFIGFINNVIFDGHEVIRFIYSDRGLDSVSQIIESTISNRNNVIAE